MTTDATFEQIEERMGVSFVDLRTMAAEVSGFTYDPGMLHAEQLTQSLGELGISSILEQADIDTIVTRHQREQHQYQGLFDLPFSEKERAISQQLFTTLLPFKHPDKYATDEELTADVAKADKCLVPVIVGRLSSRHILEDGSRYARKRRGNFHYTKWATPAQRREFVYRKTQVLDGLKIPFDLTAE